MQNKKKIKKKILNFVHKSIDFFAKMVYNVKTIENVNNV